MLGKRLHSTMAAASAATSAGSKMQTAAKPVGWFNRSALLIKDPTRRFEFANARWHSPFVNRDSWALFVLNLNPELVFAVFEALPRLHVALPARLLQCAILPGAVWLHTGA
jgi:hypothetical protein